MHYKTKGIVFNTFSYNDKNIIVKIYTELFGLQSYMVPRSKSKHSKIKINLFQPLSLIEMVVLQKEQKQFHKIEEIKIDAPLIDITGNIIKNSIALFINEIVYKSIREEESNQRLYNFLRSSILSLDSKKDHYINFHLIFLIQLSAFLGFYPHHDDIYVDGYFNMLEGLIQENKPSHPYYFSKEATKHFYKLISSTHESLLNTDISNNLRRELLRGLIKYYELHSNTVREIKSHLVLEEVIS